MKSVCSLLALALVILSSSPRVNCDNDFPNEVIPQGRKQGSCLEAGLCCKGKDSSCVVQRAPPNSIIEDLDDIPCYCDHGCVILQDCCHDFKQACGVKDCVLSSEWGPWSTCDTECGHGTMTRMKSIDVEPRNGGKACPPRVQKRGCRGVKCHHHKNKISVEDTATLLPFAFSQTRKMNDSNDIITRNLRARYPKNPEKDKSVPYCVQFRVQRETRACKSLESFITLREGNTVCVLCEQQAQKSYADYMCAGTGASNGISTRFSSLREPACHGKWKHVSMGPTCDCEQGPAFIFV